MLKPSAWQQPASTSMLCTLRSVLPYSQGSLPTILVGRAAKEPLEPDDPRVPKLSRAHCPVRPSAHPDDRHVVLGSAPTGLMTVTVRRRMIVKTPELLSC